MARKEKEEVLEEIIEKLHFDVWFVNKVHQRKVKPYQYAELYTYIIEDLKCKEFEDPKVYDLALNKY